MYSSFIHLLYNYMYARNLTWEVRFYCFCVTQLETLFLSEPSSSHQTQQLSLAQRPGRLIVEPGAGGATVVAWGDHLATTRGKSRRIVSRCRLGPWGSGAAGAGVVARRAPWRARSVGGSVRVGDSGLGLVHTCKWGHHGLRLDYLSCHATCPAAAREGPRVSVSGGIDASSPAEPCLP